ncbi:MAG: glutamate 5-kinase [Sphaerochaetaceae bacterium]|nr:glutamate 5-kinase [Sphaerochaetaceae bacterium]
MRDFSKIKRVIVKVGTNTLADEKGINEAYIEDLVSQLANLHKRGLQVLLVSSGAVGLGAKTMNYKQSVKAINLRQAFASIGQPLLMSSYRKHFKKYNIVCSQVLLTRDGLNNRKTYNNLRNSVNTLLDLKVLPIFNENDTVSTAEIGTAFGDNDRMCAMVASKMDADLMIILTDTNGLYTADPKKDPNATLISELNNIDDTVLSKAGGAGSTFSTGGMKTKLLGAQIASKAGCISLIANGKEPNILTRILDGEELGTCIYPSEKLNQRSRWILNNSHEGIIVVNNGAKDALLNHKSLLPKGIIDVKGAFKKGDVVGIVSDTNKIFAKAVVYYDSTTISSVIGMESHEMQVKLGPGSKDVIFRPEDIVFVN